MEKRIRLQSTPGARKSAKEWDAALARLTAALVVVVTKDRIPVQVVECAPDSRRPDATSTQIAQTWIQFTYRAPYRRGEDV